MVKKTVWSRQNRVPNHTRVRISPSAEALLAPSDASLSCSARRIPNPSIDDGDFSMTAIADRVE